MAAAVPDGAAELRAAFLGVQVPDTDTIARAEAWIKDFWLRRASPAAFFFLLEHDSDETVRLARQGCGHRGAGSGQPGPRMLAWPPGR